MHQELWKQTTLTFYRILFQTLLFLLLFLAQFFSEEAGELVMATALCYNFDLSIGAFARPKFSRNFISALYQLNDVIGLSDEQQMQVYKMFYKEFGTHFVKFAEFGASLNYQVSNRENIPKSNKKNDLKGKSLWALFLENIMLKL